MLFDTEIDAFRIGVPTIVAIATISTLLVIITVRIAIKVSNNRVKTGINSLLGKTGQVLVGFESEGHVRLGGEIWQAACSTPLKKGEDVRVESVQGLVLHVERKEGENHV